MQIIIAGFVFALANTATLLLFAIAMRKRKHKKSKQSEGIELERIAQGIGHQLHAAYPDTKWRWVCYPANFAVSGGIARIETIYQTGEKAFMDVCLSAKGYMALHVIDVTELASSSKDAVSTDSDSDTNVSSVTATSQETSEESSAPTTPNVATKPNDKESVGAWYNIVLIDALTNLVDDLNANGEVCLYIRSDGQVYVDESDGTSLIYNFGEMPNVNFWDFIIEKLSDEGLFAEMQDNSKIFISWA